MLEVASDSSVWQRPITLFLRIWKNLDQLNSSTLLERNTLDLILILQITSFTNSSYVIKSLHFTVIPVLCLASEPYRVQEPYVLIFLFLNLRNKKKNRCLSPLMNLLFIDYWGCKYILHSNKINFFQNRYRL